MSSPDPAYDANSISPLPPTGCLQARVNGIDESTATSTDKDVTILDWDGPNDPGNPYNWTKTRKWIVTGAALTATLIVPLNGTSITIAATEINERFNITDTADFSNSYWAVTSWSLGGALFIIVLLSVMEDVGVRIGFLATYAFFFLMVIPQALAQNFATLIVTRFFAGGCVALLANTISSVIPDVWADDRARSVPVGLYIMLYETGNTLGPPMFAGVMQFIGNWRWYAFKHHLSMLMVQTDSLQDLLHTVDHLRSILSLLLPITEGDQRQCHPQPPCQEDSQKHRQANIHPSRARSDTEAPNTAEVNVTTRLSAGH